MTRRQRHILTFLAISLLICVGVSSGWSYLWQRPCTQITITGAEYTDSATMYGLIDRTFSTQLVVDRLQRHPWVQGARAICYPTGTMRVEVLERRPHLLTLTETGRPAYYLDEFGYMMPAHTQAAFDVPLLRGTTNPYRALSPVEDQTVRDLLGLLPRLPTEIDRLISEFEVTENELTMIMHVAGADHATVVHLGDTAWEERLHKLYAFWDQQIRPREDQMVEVIDLRFRGQIVTRENPI